MCRNEKESTRKSRVANPREKANFLSKVTFYYLLPIFKKWKDGIEEKDVYEVTKKLESNTQGELLEIKWDEAQKEEKCSIIRVLLLTYGLEFFLLGLVQLFNRLMVIWFQPYFLGKFVSFYAINQTEIKLSNAYFYALSLILVNITSCVINHTYMQYILEFTVKIKSGISSLIFRKASKLSHKSLSEVGVGKIVTLMTKDVATFDTAIQLINDVWIGITQTILVSYLIYRRVGFAAIVGVGVLVLVVPIQLIFGYKVMLKRKDSAKCTDERIKQTQEALSAIKVIKMYTWEKFFFDKINDLRTSEIKKLATIYSFKAGTIITGMLSLKVSFVFLIITCILSGRILSADIIYFIYTAFNELRKNISLTIPLGISQTAELYTSLSRIQEFLLAKEHTKSVEDKKKSPKVSLKNVSVKLDLFMNGKPNAVNILDNASLNIDKNQLVVINGPTGSGKSSILKVILGEIDVDTDKVEINGRISYAPQNPWVFPATIKENILFGEDFDVKRYDDVLRVCALKYDIEQFVLGDSTIVADEGVNLSKGQLARINLARAVYRQSDIYLLDDCLASVDKKINCYIFQKCILEFLGDKIVILISNDKYHIQLANKHLIIENKQLNSLEDPLNNRVSKFIDHVEDPNKIKENELLHQDENETQSQTEPKDEDDNIIMEVLIKSDENKPLLSKKTDDIYSEENEIKGTSFEMYKSYFKFCGSLYLVVITMIFFIIAQIVECYSEKVMGDWVTREQLLNNFVHVNITKHNLTNSTNAEDADIIDDSPAYNKTLYKVLKNNRNDIFSLYSALIILTSILLLIRFIAFFALTARASRFLHEKMISCIIYTEMLFFNTHYLGNVLNRFSKDLATIDEYIPFLLFENCSLFLYVIGMFLLLAYVKTIFLLPAAFIIIGFYWMRKIYLPIGRCLRRLEASTRSPMIGTLNSLLEGLLVIRATKNEKRFLGIYDDYQNHYISTNFMAICTTRAFGFYLDILCNLYSGLVIFYLITFSRKLDPGTVGLAVTSSIAIVGLLQWAIRQWAELETNLTSLERALEYTKFKSELNDKSEGLKPDNNWPSNGEIEFKDVKMTINGNSALSGITCKIPSKKTVSIIGRTGAGKSSLVGVLFKLYQFKGDVLVDGLNIQEVDRKCLRQKIGVIPQNPIVFSGSIRTNLDPFGEYDDDQLWSIIEELHFKELVQNLNEEISLLKFSSGQRQLLNLARALLKDTKVLILDEATANMDKKMDDEFHELIKKKFKDATILNVTHRLNYVMQSDLVIVMDKGKIDLFGEPKELEKHERFAALLKDLDQ